MKTLLSLLLTIILISSCSSQNYEDGDIIFHTSRSSQSDMIKSLTKSELTHCGIIFFQKGKPYVFEAVNPVKITPLNNWISRGVGGKYKVVRLKYVLQDNHKEIMKKYAKKQLGKNYDIKFEWSDNKMYCSELVWKIYNSSGYTLSDPKTFSDYDLSDNDVFHSRTGGVVTFIGNDPGGYGLYIDIYNKDLDWEPKFKYLECSSFSYCHDYISHFTNSLAVLSSLRMSGAWN